MASHVDCLAGSMYRAEPYYNPNETVDLPKTMYKVDNIYGGKQAEGGDRDPLKALEERQDSILRRLAALKEEVDQLSKSSTPRLSTGPSGQGSSSGKTDLGNTILDIVVNVNPDSIPYALLILKKQLEDQYKVLSSCHVHSSARETPEKLRKIFQTNGTAVNRGSYEIAFTLIWKNEKFGPSMMISPSTQTSIQGETNIARYLSRILDPEYDTRDIVRATNIDIWLDVASQIMNGTNKEKTSALKTVNVHLGKKAWLVDENSPCLADILVWSSITAVELSDKAPNNVKTWYKACSEMAIFNEATKLL